MGRFEPIHDAHAIEQVALVLQTARPLDDAQIAGASEAAERFKSELPGVAQIQQFSFGFGTIGALPRVPVPFAGRVLTKTRPDGVIESELRLERGAITFRTTAYTRWDAIWAQARRYFETLLPFYVPASEIGAVALNYVDKFYWDGDVTEMRPKALLRPGSPYVCPHVYDARDLWHSHMGSFEAIDEVAKRLLNINLDCNDENQPQKRRVVSVTTVLTDMLGQPGYVAPELANSGVEFFCERAERLHSGSKSTLAAILDDQMCRRIGLKD